MRTSWCKSYKALLNGKALEVTLVENGYLSVNRTWTAGDKIILSFDMPVEMIKADDRVVENKNKRAIQRGPVVYCAEQVDNLDVKMEGITVSGNSKFTITPGEGKLNNMKILSSEEQNTKYTFVPYFAWDNRSKGKMKVWFNYTENKSLY